MTTTDLDAPDSTGGATIIPFPAPAMAPPPAAMWQAVDRLAGPVERGDGAAMLAALALARRWWDAFGVLTDRDPGDERGRQHLTMGWAALMEMVAEAPANDPAAVLAKARLAAWRQEAQMGEALWEPALALSLCAGVARFLPVGGVVAHG